MSIILVTAVIGAIILAATSSSRKLNKAKELTEEGKFSEAEKIFSEIYEKSLEAPAEFVSMYIAASKKADSVKSEVSYLKKGLNLPTDKLSPQARTSYNDKRKTLVKHIAEKAKEYYSDRKFDDAVKLSSLIENEGQDNHNSWVRYKTRFIAHYYAETGQDSDTIKRLLRESPGIASPEVIDVAEEYQRNSKDQFSVRLIELIPENKKALELFDRIVLANIKNKNILTTTFDKSLKNRAIETAENYLCGLDNSKLEKKIAGYSAILCQRNDRDINEKLESLYYQKASACLADGRYDEFKHYFSSLAGNDKVSSSFKKSTLDSYRSDQLDFLIAKAYSRSLTSELLPELFQNVDAYGKENRHADLVSLAKELSSQKQYSMSNTLCAYLIQGDDAVQDIVISNVSELLKGSVKYDSIGDIYKNSALYGKIASCIFGYAEKLSTKGDSKKAISLCKLIEDIYPDKENLTIFQANIALDVAMACTVADTPNALSYVRSIYHRKEAKANRSSMIERLLSAAEKYFNEKSYQKAFLLSAAPFSDESSRLSEIYIDCAYELCKAGKKIDIQLLDNEIRKKKDRYPDYARFITYIPEFNEQYVIWSENFISNLAKESTDKAIEAFDAMRDEQSRASLLSGLANKEIELFEAISLHLLSDPQKYLAGKKVLTGELVTQLGKYQNELFAATCLRNLKDFDTRAEGVFISVTLAMFSKEADRNSRLSIINDALSVSTDSRLNAAKKDVAASFAKDEPDYAISICKELKSSGLDLSNILLTAYLAKAKGSSDLSEKDKYLKLAGKQLSDMLSDPAGSRWTGWGICREQDNWNSDIKMTEGGVIYKCVVALVANKLWKLRSSRTWSENRGAKSSSLGTAHPAIQDGGALTVAKDGFYRVEYDSSKESILISKVDEYFEFENLASALAESFFRLKKTEDAYRVLHYLPSSICENLILNHKLSESKAISGDSAAIDFLNATIDAEISSAFVSSPNISPAYAAVWDELTTRTLQKAEKQARPKSIQALKDLLGRIHNDINLNKELLLPRIHGVLHDLCVEEGRELEERGQYAESQAMYKVSCDLQTDSPAVGRYAICSVKRNDVKLSEVSADVRNAIGKIPADIQKDLLYRFVLRLLREGEVNEAEDIVKKHLRSKALVDLCESTKLKQVKSLMLDFNQKIESLTKGTMEYKDAVKFISSIPELAKPITAVYPEYQGLFAGYPNKLNPYLIKAAFRSGDYKLVFKQLRGIKDDFISDDTLFRNIAVSCLGIIEDGGLTRTNYKEIISIWLTAVFCDRLIVKSLDYTSWDDGYTFCLDDSLSQTYKYPNLPDNINFDEPSETNISIGSVQKSLLERTEGMLSNGERIYYEFYLEQKKAMTDLVNLFGAETGDAIAPYTYSILPGKYSSNLKHRLLNEADYIEDGLRVGCLYGFSGDKFDSYKGALTSYSTIKEKASTLSVINVTPSNRAAADRIDEFSDLKENLISELSDILSKHINDNVPYVKILDVFGPICTLVGDRRLSFKLTDHINSSIIPKLNNNEMDEGDGLKILFKAYCVDSSNNQLKENIGAILSKLTIGYLVDSSNWEAISTVIKGTKDFNGKLLSSLSSGQAPLVICAADNSWNLNNLLNTISQTDPSQSLAINKLRKAIEKSSLQKELSAIIDKVNDNSMSGKDALSKIYDIYVQDKDNSRICENLAIISSRCIIEYIASGKYGSASVKSVLDKLAVNQSPTFKASRKSFNEAYYDMAGHFSADQILTIKLGYLNDNVRNIKAAFEYLNKFREHDSFDLI